MYRASDPQRKLFDAGGLLTPAKLQGCEKSWAGPFRQKCLPLLRRIEDEFASLFDPQLGRPNRPVPLVVGVLILKDMFDLTDEEAVQALDFDARWWYAFELEPHDLHLCEKTLYNFRTELMLQDKSKVAFRRVTDGLITALGIGVEHQRLDSKQIVSNIAILTRLGLMCETIRVFLAGVKELDPKAYAALSGGLLQRHGEKARYADARSKDGRRRLEVVARDVWRLIDRFGSHEAVMKTEAWRLLKRVFEEQCEPAVPEAAAPRAGDDDEGDGPAPVGPRRELCESRNAEGTAPSAGAGPSAQQAGASAAPPAEPPPPTRLAGPAPDARPASASATVELQTPESLKPDGGSRVNAGPSPQPTAAVGGSLPAAPAAQAAAQAGTTETPLRADDDADGPAPARLRPAKDVGSDSLQTPHDAGVTYSGHKGKGYAAQVAETCGNGAKPEMITDVDVTRACDSDAKATVPMVQSLEAAGHKPKELVADTGFSGGENAAALADKGVRLLAPVPAPAKPKPGQVYEAPAATCPTDPVQATRWLTLQEASPDFRRRYAIRAGAEGTMSELTRGHGLSKLRVRGEKRVKLATYFKALACNVKRALKWWLELAMGAAKAEGAAVPA